MPVDALPDRGTLDPDPDGAKAPLVRAVAGLPPKQRTAVWCRSVLGMPYEELSELLDCSNDAARRNVHEGLKTLREELRV